MISRHFFPYISEFVEYARKIEKVISIVLFGSIAKGEADKRSDIDLLVILDEKKIEGSETLEGLKRVKRSIEEKGARLELTVMNVEDFRRADKNFVEDIIREGVLLFGKPLVLKTRDLELSPYVIFLYSMKNLTSPDKLKLHRSLYGRRTVKKVKGKKYISETRGLIEEGSKLGSNVIIFPEDKAKEVRAVLNSFGASYVEMKIFTPLEEIDKLKRL